MRRPLKLAFVQNPQKTKTLSFLMLMHKTGSVDAKKIKIYFNRLVSYLSCITSVLFPLIFSSPANLQQRLLGFMRPDGASSQQVQQELQRKYHSES